MFVNRKQTRVLFCCRYLSWCYDFETQLRHSYYKVIPAYKNLIKFLYKSFKRSSYSKLRAFTTVVKLALNLEPWNLTMTCTLWRQPWTCSKSMLHSRATISISVRSGLESGEPGAVMSVTLLGYYCCCCTAVAVDASALQKSPNVNACQNYGPNRHTDRQTRPKHKHAATRMAINKPLYFTSLLQCETS